MSKTYVLKSWNEVSDHHFISEKRWKKLCESELCARFCDGILETTAIIYPKNDTPTLDNTFMVKKSDLREVVSNVPTNENAKVNDNKDVPAEKTYTKAEIREAGMRVMKGITCEDSAIESAIAIAKLINELN